MTKRRKEWFTTGEAAAQLDFTIDTIRAHLVPIEEHEKGSGKVPFKTFGSRRLIPRWWVDEWTQALGRPPSEANQHGET